MGLWGASINSYKSRMIKIMKRNSRNSRAGRTAVLAVALGILLFSNAVAKEADVPVNMLFSRNVKFAERGQFEVVKVDKIS